MARPPTYHSDDERPTTVSVRIPRELYHQAKAYAVQRRTTITELLLDGLRLRLETPAGPRDIVVAQDNTVIQELQEMIRAAVEKEVSTLRDFLGPHASAVGLLPPPEAPPASVPAMLQDDTTGVQDIAHPVPEAIDAQIDHHISRLEHRIHEIQHDDNITVIQEQLPEAVTPQDDIQHYENTVIQERDVAAQKDGTGTAPAAARTRRGRQSGPMRQRILSLLSMHQEGLSAEQIRAHLTPERPIGDTLQGMRKTGVLRTEGRGKAMRYLLPQQTEGSTT